MAAQSSPVASQLVADLHSAERVEDDPTAPASYIHQVTARLQSRDPQGDRAFIGYAQATLVRGEEAAVQGIDVIDMPIRGAQSRIDAGALFGADAALLGDQACHALGRPRSLTRNLLVLENMVLLPRVRGQGVGLRVARHLMARLGVGMGCCLIRPEPMQFYTHERLRQLESAGISLAQLGQDYPLAQEKLMRHAEQLGFTRLPDGDHLVFNLAHSIPQPSTPDRDATYASSVPVRAAV